MQNLNKALVVYDLSKTEHLALQRSLDLARSYDMEICLFTSTYHYSYEMTGYLSEQERKRIKQRITAEAQHKLEKVAKELEAKGLKVTTSVGWGNRFADVLLSAVEELKPDLVIKAYQKRTDALTEIIFTPSDWNILRKCPVDVLLVKEGSWPENTHILASLDVMAEDKSHQKLNHAVLSTGQTLADMCNVDFHVCNVYPYPLVDVPLAYSSIDYENISNEMKNAHMSKMKALVDEFQIDEKSIHLEQGLAEEQIAEIAKEIQADLIVMGTVGRKGISGLVMGNTAEQILDSINCDVWAVKPN